MLVVVGLRNHGYAGTRHNVAEAVLLRLAKQHNLSFNKAGSGMEVAQFSDRVVLALPRTFMNLSGKPVKQLMQQYKPVSLLVCHDELDLALGKARVRPQGGSARGHNGLKSIIAHLGNFDAFPRVCVGIDRPPTGKDNAAAVSAHVLGKFTPQEQASGMLDSGLDLAVAMLVKEIDAWEKKKTNV